MVAVINPVTFDCADALVLARFRAAALGSDVDGDATAEQACVEAAGWGGPNIWFIRVPDWNSRWWWPRPTVPRSAGAIYKRQLRD